MTFSSPRESNPLCCCEYIDKDGSRNHILACCCNCVELDRAVDSLCCCRNRDKSGWNQVLQLCSDRMRIPWVGGAKQLSCEVVLPLFLLPALFVFGAQNPPCTAIAFLSMPFLILQLHRVYFRSLPFTKFYCSWTYTSLLLIFIIYEVLVVPFLEISTYENLFFIAVSAVALFSLFKVQTIRYVETWEVDVESAKLPHSVSKTSFNTCLECGAHALPRMVHCNTCQKCIPKRELHCLWFGCCIGSHNLLWFLLCLLSLSMALLYSSNLILTTVCRPYQFLGPILLPEDCGEVYYEFRFAICFVSGMYSLIMAVPPVFALIRQCWLVSLGITGNEWRTMPLSHLLRLGLTAYRPHSQGFFLNWYYVLSGRNK